MLPTDPIELEFCKRFGGGGDFPQDGFRVVADGSRLTVGPRTLAQSMPIYYIAAVFVLLCCGVSLLLISHPVVRWLVPGVIASPAFAAFLLTLFECRAAQARGKLLEYNRQTGELLVEGGRRFNIAPPWRAQILCIMSYQFDDVEPGGTLKTRHSGGAPMRYFQTWLVLTQDGRIMHAAALISGIDSPIGPDLRGRLKKFFGADYTAVELQKEDVDELKKFN